MTRVVAVHGIGKQLSGEEVLLKDWQPALADGLRRTGGPVLPAGGMAMAFYGDLFRPPGQTLTVGDPLYTPADVDDGFEQDLLFAWWEAAAAADEQVAAPDRDTLLRTPWSVQSALRALSRSRFFSGLALRALVCDLKQSRRYLEEPRLRQAALDRVRAAIGQDTRVVVAHSLGSVVAYEALCSLPEHPVRALVTIGSPLGVPMVVDRLQPAPNPPKGWPGGQDLVWTNLADRGDVVALVKDLRPVFGDRVHSVTVDNGAHAHDATAYLTDACTGAAVAAGLDAH